MARNKESLVLVIDVAPSMHALLPAIEKVCCLLAQKKLIYSACDEVELVAFGTSGSPLSSAELDAVKFKPEKGVKLLGFTDASNILRHNYMKDVNLFIAEPGKPKAILTISALARAMKEMNKVAIVRCVWRQGQANVVVGLLTPYISEKDNIADSFYFNVLPFAEDVREFQFPSFSNLPYSMQPIERQQEAADNLVHLLDLSPPGKEKVFQPSLTPNPMLERFFHARVEIKGPKC